MDDIDKKIIEYILDENNRDDAEYAYLYSMCEYGLYISPPIPSAKECGEALRSMLERIK